MPENTHKSIPTALGAICILLPLSGGTMFLCLDCFMDTELLPKRYCFLAGIAVWALLAALCNRREIRIPVSRLTLSFVLLAGYMMARELLSPLNIGVAYTAGVFALFFLCLRISPGAGRRIDLLIVGLCIAQGVYGLVEYAGMDHSYADFPIQGSFDNPAGLACCVAVGYPFCLFYLHRRGGLKWVGAAGAAVIVLSVALSQSRTGMLMLTAATVLFYGIRYKRRLTEFKSIVIPVSVLVLTAFSAALFHYKPASALGRIAIWRNTAGMIADNWAFGGGSGSFLADYMPCQAACFAACPDSRYAQLASNVYHPFNEYLLLAAQYGVIGVLLLAALVCVVLKYGGKDSPYMLVCVSAGVGALFSYISWYPFVWFVVIYALARLSRQMSPLKTVTIRRSCFAAVCLTLAAGFSYALCRDIGFEYRWKRTAAESLAGHTAEVLPDYERLHARWNGNPFFLYNYGAELNYIKEYARSRAVLDTCRKYLNSYDVQIMQADNHLRLGEWDKAQTCYTLAAHMCPNRFVPLTGLLDIFIRTGPTASADSVARKILTKRIKIHSNITTDARNKAKAYLDRRQ